MLDDFLIRAALAGLAVALAAAPLGCFVVWRRMAYFGATLAHASLLGVAFGLLLSVAMQAMIHVQVNSGLAPPKGMTLPFISDGGTSLLVSSFAVGLALGASRRYQPPGIVSEES